MVETNIDEIADWLEERELYIGAHMIKRDKDEAEGLAPNTYLGLAMAAPVDRGAVRPVVTGATEMVVLPGPAWCHDPTGQEPPLGIDISELPALGGASEPLHSSVEVSAPVQDGSSGERQ
jgi:hypothetical protein